MYGVPEDLDLDFLVGATLTQVAIGEYQVDFRFTPHASISVMGQWEIRDRTDRLVESAEQRPYAMIQNLLGKKLTSYHLRPPQYIELTFSDETRLRVIDDDQHYESFSIQPGNIFV